MQDANAEAGSCERAGVNSAKEFSYRDGRKQIIDVAHQPIGKINVES
jgi:hypothetical protein